MSLREIGLKVSAPGAKPRLFWTPAAACSSERVVLRIPGTQEYAELKAELIGNTTKLGAFISLYMGLTQHDGMALVRHATAGLPNALALGQASSHSRAPGLSAAHSSGRAEAWPTWPSCAGTSTTWCGRSFSSLPPRGRSGRT